MPPHSLHIGAIELSSAGAFGCVAVPGSASIFCSMKTSAFGAVVSIRAGATGVMPASGVI